MSTDRQKTFGSKDLEKRMGKLTVGEFLHAWRVSEDIRLADFGKLVGMSLANLCDIEKGRKGVSPEKAEQIAKAIGVPQELLICLSIEESLRAAGLNYRVQIKPAA